MTKLLDIKAVRTLIPMSRTTLWRLVRAGSFPKPLKLAASRVAWREDEITQWVEVKSKQRERKDHAMATKKTTKKKSKK